MKVKDLKTSINEIFKCTKEGAVTEMHIKILEAKGIKPLNVTCLWSWYNEWDEFVRYADHETDPKPSWEFPAEAGSLFTIGELAESVDMDVVNNLLYYVFYNHNIKAIMNQCFKNVARELLPSPLNKWKKLGPHEYILMQRMQFTLPVLGSRTLEEDAYLFDDLKSTPYWLDFIKFYKARASISEEEQRAMSSAIDALQHVHTHHYVMMIDKLMCIKKHQLGSYRQASEAIKKIILNCHF